MNNKKAQKIIKNYVCPTYGQRNLILEKGNGTIVYDVNGKEYLDFLSGIAVSSLGHNNKKLHKNICEQSKKVVHTSNLYHNLPQLEFSEKLGNMIKGYKFFYCNSGAESNEAAIKLCRKYFYKTNKNKTDIITFKQSFHGRTLATVTATGQPKYQKYFKPLLPNIKYAEFNNINSVKKLITKKTAAIMIELVQCEGGINVATKKFVNEIKNICKNNSLLLIVDEVQTGTGRTGKIICSEHYNLKPDIFTLAKGIAAGVPMGVMAAKKKIADMFEPGDHASTFGGGPLACAAGLTVLDFLNKKNLKSVFDKGEYFKQKLKKVKGVEKVRGYGLIIGVELEKEIADNVVKKCEQNGLLLNSIKNKVIRIAPPLTVKKTEINKAIKIIKNILEN